MAPWLRQRASLAELLSLGTVLLISGAVNGQASGGNATNLLSTVNPTATTTTTTSPGPNIAAIVAPVVILGLLLLAAVAAVVVLQVKKKRQTEGTYRPSSEEQSGARSVQVPDALKLPKEERLI
ncbi:hypothetical protein GJAV_G00220580 [Gymnothorax javanicus]|nr:hypothetical protein GJAV_G00220580 [Gymnothorax javanicus]